MNDKTLYIHDINEEMYTLRNWFWVMYGELSAEELIRDPLSDNEIVLTDWFVDPHNPSEIEISLFKLEFGITVKTDSTDTFN